jgi:hypothetical protein
MEPRGTIVFGTNAGLYQVSASGGGPIRITTVDTSRGETAHSRPHFLPDGRRYLYAAVSGTSNSVIRMGSLDSRESTALLPAAEAVYAPPGYLLFRRAGTLFGQPFDVDDAVLSAEPVPVSDDLTVPPVAAATSFSVSGNLLVYRSTSGPAPMQQFVWFDRMGRELAPAGDAGPYEEYFDLSADGQQIAAGRTDPQASRSDVWIIDWRRGITTRSTIDAATQDVVWSPDGARLAITTVKTGNPDIVIRNASGLGADESVAATLNREIVEDWSSDGRYLVYALNAGGSGGAAASAQDLWVAPLFGDRKHFPIVQSPFRENEPQLSFDGKWLAYNSDESGTWQVYVISFPSGDQKRQISIRGGAQPQWRKDGTELYYLDPEGKMMTVDIAAEPSLTSGVPRVLFDTGLSLNPTNDQYRVTGDGQRFLVLKGLEESTPPPINVVFNWPALLAN